MILRTENIHPEINGTTHSPDSKQPFTHMLVNSPLPLALDLATEVAS